MKTLTVTEVENGYLIQSDEKMWIAKSAYDIREIIEDAFKSIKYPTTMEIITDEPTN